MPAISRLPIALVLSLFVIVGGTFAVTTPLFEASDELWHYPVIWRLARGQGLPVLDANNPGPWRQEAGQPPLYYYIMALTTGWIDTTDMRAVRQLNAHVDNGVVTADGNTNLAIHSAGENFPWRGTVLAVRLVRLLSVLLGAGTVYLTYLLALQIRPDWPWLAVGAAGVLAFTPMFAFISAAVNNDNLAMLLASAAVLLITRMSARGDPGRKFRFALNWQWERVRGHISIAHLTLGGLLGLGALTKLSLLALFPLAAAVIAYNQAARWWRNPHRTRAHVFWLHALILLLQCSVTFGFAATISGWWFRRNLRLYGTLTGINAFVDVLGRRAHPAPLAQLWSERAGFMQSFWGLFGAVNVPFPHWVYTALNIISALAIAGLVIFIIQKWSDDRWTARRWLPLGVVVAFNCAVIFSLLRWATETWSSQGRLVFTAIQSLVVLFTIGLSSLLPRRWPLRRQLLIMLVVLFLFVLSAGAPRWVIAPAYAPPPPADLETMTTAHQIDFGKSRETAQMRLLGYTLPSASLRPGEALELTLYWQSIAAADEDWSVFIHLQDSADTLVAQRDTYPGLGLLPTSQMQPGRTFADRYVLPVPATAYAPAELHLNIGLYDYSTGERMRTPDDIDSAQLATVELAVNTGQHPNPQRTNFQNRIELVGYEIDRRVLVPGEGLELTLYWRGQRPLRQDYTVFAQVRGEGDRVWGQHDSWPAAGAAPTSGLTPGAVVRDVHPLTLAADVPPGTYGLQIGLYDSVGQRLQIITTDGRWTHNYLSLSRIRVSEEQTRQ